MSRSSLSSHGEPTSGSMSGEGTQDRTLFSRLRARCRHPRHPDTRDVVPSSTLTHQKPSGIEEWTHQGQISFTSLHSHPPGRMLPTPETKASTPALRTLPPSHLRLYHCRLQVCFPAHSPDMAQCPVPRHIAFSDRRYTTAHTNIHPKHLPHT